MKRANKTRIVSSATEINHMEKNIKKKKAEMGVGKQHT